MAKNFFGTAHLLKNYSQNLASILAKRSIESFFYSPFAHALHGQRPNRPHGAGASLPAPRFGRATHKPLAPRAPPVHGWLDPPDQPQDAVHPPRGGRFASCPSVRTHRTYNQQRPGAPPVHGAGAALVYRYVIRNACMILLISWKACERKARLPAKKSIGLTCTKRCLSLSCPPRKRRCRMIRKVSRILRIV